MSLLALMVMLGPCVSFANASTGKEVKERGHLLCGVSTGNPGFSSPGEKGEWSGVDVDVCRAVAAALLGDHSKVKYISLDAREQATALLAGEVDLLARNTNWTMTRDTALGLHFTAPSFHDRLGFLVPVKLGVSEVEKLEGRTICTITGTSAGVLVKEEFERRNLELKSLTFDTFDALIKGFEAGRCDAASAPTAQLLGIKGKLPSPDSALLLPEYYGKITMGPMVRRGDDAWFSLVRWVIYAMINGDELQISSQNIDSLQGSNDPRIERFLGVDGNLGKGLGLTEAWAYRIVKQVGNYSESYERNLGTGSPFKLNRGLNELWSRGGLLIAPELR